MTTTSNKQALDELIKGELGRHNYDALTRLIYASYANVDHTDEQIRALEKDLEKASGEEARNLTEKLGILHLARGNYERAVELLQAVHTRKSASHFLGRALLKLQREEEAIEHLERGRSGDDDVQTDVLLVEALCNLRRVQEAQKVVKASTAPKDSADLLYALGRIAEAEGEYDRAMELYEQALEKDPSHALSLFRLAWNCDLNGNDERAIELYERCTRLQPTSVGALMNLGVLYEDHGRYEEAVECYKRVLAIEPTHQRAMMYLKDAEASLHMYIRVAPPRRLSALDELFGLPEGTHLEDEEEEEELEEPYGAEQVADIFAAGEEVPLQERLRMPVEALELSTRARKCMERLKIKTVADLLQHSKKELFAVPNFGTTSLKELETKLAALGLSLKND